MSTPALTYRPDVDGLRAVAVLLVVAHHLLPGIVPGGYVGVDVFFVISGYLITAIISPEMQDGSFTFRRFYERRVRRLFPALFTVLGATTIAGYFILLPSDYSATLRGVLGTLFFSSNIVFWRDMSAGYFAATDAAINPLLHTWSLGVEEQFYLFFPLLLLFCLRRVPRHATLILLACGAASLVVAAALVKPKVVAVFFLSPFRGWELLAGSLLALGVLPPLRNRAMAEIVSLGGLLAILASGFLYSPKTTFPGISALAPVLGASAIIYAGAFGRTQVRRSLSVAPVVYVGLISYSLYLWHWPLIVFTRYAIGLEPVAPYAPALFIASLFLAAFSYHFIERPFRGAVGVPWKWTAVSSAVAAGLLAVTSISGILRSGFVDRFEPVVVQLDRARTPVIPYAECDDQLLSSACRLGAANTQPTVLLWGDSHILSWGPALNSALQMQGLSAVFAASSTCPPLLTVASVIKPTCSERNLAVRDYLSAHPEVKVVVIAAYWSTYFRPETILRPLNAVDEAPSIEIPAGALHSTLKWLGETKHQVVLLGPVPVYEKSVPMALALQAVTHQNILHSANALDQKRKHARFFEVVSSLQPAPWLHVGDPINWMCNGSCMTIGSGVPLYRDSHHLSVAGAKDMTKNLGELITAAAKAAGHE
jgi:peptidoglycan/LPS O-acetylase OafA/YrhL